MKITLSILLIITCNTFSFSQNKETLIPFKKAKLWGFSDIDRNIIIKPQYDTVHFFNRNLSKVVKNKLIGYINKKGEEIIPIKFNYCRPIPNSLFIVQKETKYGIIDTLKNYIVTLKFEEIKLLDAEFYLVKNNGLFGIIKLEDKKFKLIIKPSFEKIKYISYRNKFICLKKDKEYIHDLVGQVIEKRILKRDESFEESVVTIEGITESQSNIKVKKKYPHFIPIYDKKFKGLIIETKSNKIKNYGKILKDTIYPKYDSINPKHWFSNCFVVKQKNKWGAINKKGKTIIDIEYSDIDIKSMSFQNFRTKPYRQTFIVKKDKKWGLIGNTNKFRKSENKNEVLIPFKYDSIRKNVNGSFFIVKSKKMYGVILSENLKLITELKYSNIKDTYNKIDDFIIINITNEKGKTLFVGQNGIEFFEN